MEQYINKTALVAEINQRIEDYKSHKIDDSYHDGLIFALEDLRDDFINTLEVKEVDLDLEIKKAQRKYKTIEEYEGYPCTMYANNIECIAKHFFELGIKASNTLTWEDINSIDHLLFDIKEDYDNGKLDKEKYYKEVLKKFKAQL